MFYYFGRKKRLASRYPSPKCSQIIEPFAGSAAYSLHGNHWEKEVWINDLDANVVALWQYLQSVTIKDIEHLPDFAPGDRLSDVMSLSPVERLLIGRHTGPGKNSHNDVVSRFSRWPAGKRYIAANLHKIRHWRVTNWSYEELPNMHATWFIDPPYQRSGRLYRHHDIDFKALGEWCKTRSGYTIACEQDGADWLDFQHLTAQQNGRHRAHEYVWYNNALKNTCIVEDTED